MLMRSYPILSRFLFLIILPLLLVLGGAYITLLQSLPQQQGTLYLSGLQAPATVVRDDKAIPHITAKSDDDAFFTLGYLHAQDRMWQMSYTKRLGQGRLSEIMGVESLTTDQYMRTLGLYRVAETALQSLDAHAIKALEAYALGVNAWIEEGHTLPIEYHLLETRPETWRPVDSILVMKMMAFNLGRFNFGRELTLDLLIKELGVAKANELRPDVNSFESNSHESNSHESHAEAVLVSQVSGLLDSNLTRELLAQSQKLQPLYPINGEGVGSNAWAVSGEHTQSGLPMLASDPHLALEIPSVWYLAKIQGDRLNVTGATYPGVPAVFMGRNESIAWGITNMLADAQDYYVERINPLNEDQYEMDGQWLDMELEEEIIYVKSDFPQFLTHPIPPVKWQVRRTRHGPLISDAIERTEYPMSMRWSGLDTQDKSFQGFLDMNYAQNWESFTAAFEGYTAPSINAIYADVHGDIGLYAAGKIPVRGQGDGRLPAPGWLSSYEWKGYIPREQLPHQYNPESGYVVNANNRNHGADYPYIIANTWSPYYRVERIRRDIQTQIDAQQKITAADFVALQGNVESLQVQELLGFFRNLAPRNKDQQEAIEALQNWDGALSADSKEAVIYQVWLRHFNAAITRDDLKGTILHEARGDELQGFVSTINPTFVSRVVHRSPDIKTNWCDSIDTPAVESCEEIALDALDSANREIHRFLGAGKRWGDIHETRYPHQVFTNVQLLDAVFDRSISSEGDRYTVNSGNWSYSQEDGYVTGTTSNYRQVIDLADRRKGGFINNTGQSGNLLSRHYDDNIEPFKQLKLWSMALDMEGDNHKDHLAVLNLQPEPSSQTSASRN